MFFDEKSFDEKPKFNLIDDSKIEECHEQSYFIEAAEELTRLNESRHDQLMAALDKVHAAFEKGVKLTYTAMDVLGLKADNVIQNSYNSFSSNFANIFKRDTSWFKKHEEELKSYSGENIEMNKSRYKYTIPASIPNMKPLKDLIEDLQKFQYNVNKEILAKDKALSIEIKYNELFDMIHGEGYYQKTRQSILNTKLKISTENYYQEIFDVFRDNGKEITDSITPKNVKDIAIGFVKYSKFLDNVAKERREFRNLFLKLNNVSKSFTVDMDQFSSDMRLNKAFAKYIQLKQDQIFHVSEMYSLAVSGKLDAMLGQYLQDRNILLDAVKFNNKGGEKK